MRFQEVRVNTKILHKMPYEPPQSFVRIVCKRALDAFHMKPKTKKNGDLFLFGFIGEGSLISTRETVRIIRQGKEKCKLNNNQRE